MSKRVRYSSLHPQTALLDSNRARSRATSKLNKMRKVQPASHSSHIKSCSSLPLRTASQDLKRAKVKAVTKTGQVEAPPTTNKTTMSLLSRWPPWKSRSLKRMTVWTKSWILSTSYRNSKWTGYRNLWKPLKIQSSRSSVKCRTSMAQLSLRPSHSRLGSLSFKCAFKRTSLATSRLPERTRGSRLN